MPETTNISGIKREEALLSWIERSAPYGVIVLNELLQVQSWNHWMEQHSGMALKEVFGRELFALYPDLRIRNLVTPFERALNGESSVLSASLHRNLLPLPSPLRDGIHPHMRQTARINPLLADGVVCGVVVVIEDVTQREVQAEILRHQHRRDEVLSWALAHFLKSEEPRKTIRQVFFKIAEYMDFDTFLFYLRDVETESLELYTAGGVPKELEKDFARCSLMMGVAAAGDLVVFNSLQDTDKPEFTPLKKAGASAAIALPLMVNKRNVGLLCFATWSRESIAPEESDLLTTLAQFLATAVDRENTYAQLQKAQLALMNHSQLLEEKVAERTSRLQETVSELETFSYTLAHDLRAPVRGITGYAQVLLEDFTDKLPPGALLVIKKQLRSSKRMEALIQDLLAFSRISREAVVLAPIRVETIIDDLLALRVPSVRDAITVRIPLSPVSAHKALLEQVLANLIDNAIKFVDPLVAPQITIYTESVAHASPSTRSSHLLFSSTEPEQQVMGSGLAEISRNKIRIWVEDNGIGIAAEAHQKIFGIFERNHTSNIYEGTGMGLAIVARAVQRMGGTCGVISEPGKGSRFWVELNAGQNFTPSEP